MRIFLTRVLAVFCGLGLYPLKAEYTAPLPNPKVFTETLTLEEPARLQIVDVLVDWSRSRVSELKPLSDSDWKMISRALALSKLLKSSHRGYVIANFQLSSHANPTKPDRILSGVEASDLLLKTISGTELKNSTKKNDQVLYGYLIEIVASMNPANEDAIVDFSLQKEKAVNNWSVLLPGEGASAPASAPAVSPAGTPIASASGQTTWSGPQLRSIKSLFVMETGAGIWIGKANNLIGTVSSTRPEGGIGATFDRSSMPEVPTPSSSSSSASSSRSSSGVGSFGSEMRITLDEALRLANSRHLGLKGAPYISLGFEDKYTPKDGGSIGAACALLILSIVDNYEIDPAFAVTGDINADGKIKAVGGISAKIEGAYAGSAKAVMIPSENKEDLEEMVVMNQEKLLGKIQVFSISTIQEAQELIRTDKTENITKSMALFKELQDKGTYPADKLKEILALTPNHLSAKIFASMSEGSISRTLTYKSSVNHIIGSAGPFVSILLEERNRNLNLDRTDKFTIPELPKQLFESCRNELTKISGKIDPRTQNLYWSITGLVSSWEELQDIQSKSNSETSRRKFLEARANFHDNLSQLQMNEDSLKALLR